MDLARIQQILSNKMAKQEPKRKLLSDGMDIVDNNKIKIGKQYEVFSGPFGAKVQVMDNNPNEYRVMYQGKTQIMSPEQADEFFTAQNMALEVPFSELMRKSAASKGIKVSK
jgi:hypothetical protein